MKLYFSPASPFVRKVVVTALELDLGHRLQNLPSAAHPVNRDATVAAFNPTGKVPTLITDDELPLYDSRVICEYLDSLDGQSRIFPPAGPARWRALREQALGDALLDAALLVRYETLVRPKESSWQPWIDGQMRKIHSVVAAIESDASKYGERFDIGTLTLACALGYLDFRFPSLDWRDGHANATSWFERVSTRTSMQQSFPRDPS